MCYILLSFKWRITLKFYTVSFENSIHSWTCVSTSLYQQELDFSPADCPPLASPSNGVIHGNINTHGSWARLECDATSLSVGGFTRSRCDAGIWTPPLACIGLLLIDSNACISEFNNYSSLIWSPTMRIMWF